MLTSLCRYFSQNVRRNEKLHLLEIFKPLYHLLSALGLMPCSIEFPHGKLKCFILHKSALTQSLYALFPLLVVHIFTGLFVYEVIISHYDAVSKTTIIGDEMATANYFIELLIQLTFCICAYFCAFQKRDLYVSMLKRVNRSWDDLPHVNRGNILEPLRSKVNYIVFCALPLILISLMASTLLDTYTSIWEKILLTFSAVVLEMIHFTVVTLYFVLVLLVVALLKNIEDHCQMYLKARRSIKNSISKVELARIPVTLSHIQSVYVNALCIKREINIVFQAPILVSLLQCFHTIISESFSMYQEFSYFYFIECCYWLLLPLIKIYALAYSGTLFKSQANDIGRTIHNIQRCDDEDIQLFVEIQHFSTLITFEDTEITIFDLFPLETSLMFNMVAAATTYLIILVQFAQPS